MLYYACYHKGGSALDAERIDGVNRFMGRRPLALAAACYGAGALVGYYGYVPPIFWCAGIALSLIPLVFRGRAVLIYAALLFAGAAVTGGCALVPEAIPQSGVLIRGVVCQEPVSDDVRSVLTLDRVYIAGQRHPFNLRLYVYGDPVEASLGDQAQLVGDTWLPQGQRNPGGFDFRAFLWTRGGVLCATGLSGDFQAEEGGGFSPRHWIAWARRRIGVAIDRLFPQHAALVRALVLGDRGALSDELKDDFRAAGIAHLLAISGLHVSCLALALEYLLRALRMSRKQAVVTTLALLFLYAALIGFPPSVVRAGVMFLLMRGAILSGRPPDSLTGLSAAFLLLLFIRPLYIADAGFQLSFSAVAGMLMLKEPVAALIHAPQAFLWPGFGQPRRAAKWLWAWGMGLLATGVAIQLGTLPVMIGVFGALTLLAPLINLVAIPLTTLALPLVIVKLLLGVLFPAIGAWMALPDRLLSLLETLANRAAQLSYSSVNLPGWPAWLTSAYLVAIVCASPYVRFRLPVRKLLPCALPVLVAVSVGLAWARLPDGLNLTFLDAGQADATVIRAEGQTYLVDVGKAGGAADDYLVYTGQPVKAVFLTHPHADHVGGLGALLKRMRPQTIYLPECWDRVEAEGDVNEQLQLAAARGTRIERLAAGDVVRLSEGVECEVLQPAMGYQPLSGNGASLVLMVRCGDGSALLCGDLPSAEELSYYPDADVLKAAHHGANSSTSELMLRTARPSVLVISVGRNSFGHPSERVIGRAGALGAQIYRTDQCGAVFARIEQDGRVRMSTFLKPEDEA